MFNEPIFSATLASEAADRLFSNITSSNTPDKSFTATLRALLRKRLPQDKTVCVSCREVRVSADELSGNSLQHCMQHWFIPESLRYNPESAYNIFIVHTANSDTGEKMLEMVRENVGNGRRYLGGYSCLEDLWVYYARKVNVKACKKLRRKRLFWTFSFNKRLVETPTLSEFSDNVGYPS